MPYLEQQQLLNSVFKNSGNNSFKENVLEREQPSPVTQADNQWAGAGSIRPQVSFSADEHSNIVKYDPRMAVSVLGGFFLMNCVNITTTENVWMISHLKKLVDLDALSLINFPS